MKNAGLVMAWRNLWRRGRRTWLTVGAMVFSNILLVFSISLQFGSYDMMIDNSLQAYTGHLQLQHPRYLDDPRMRYALADVAGTAHLLREKLGLQSISARATGFALASSKERSFGLQIVGVDAAHEPLVSTLPGLVRQGQYLKPEGREEIVIGSVLARNLKVRPGDELTFLGSGYDDSFAAGVVRVAGIFTSGITEIDRGMAQVNLGYFQQVFAMGDRGHNVVIRAPSIEQVNSLAARIGALGIVDGKEVVLRNWDELQPGLRQAIQADMTSAWFMYMVLIVLVAFSVLNTQLMSVLERTREFGTMLALGLKPARLARLVMQETALMTALGLGLGIAGGFLLTWYLSYAGFSYPGMKEMSERFYLPDRMYPAISLLSLTLGPSIVALGSLLASIYPATRLYRLSPVAAMRAV
ncbi:MAG TPA: FtsX-like permease family protein [Gammaproteobacteria bacterium]|nr:FtsX-like permease family protein [Gammaproteobacteria bacterium]